MYPTEKEWDELSPKEKEQSNFEFFKAQLVLRDKYLKEYEGYLVKKSKEIGLQDYSKLGELCFVLSKRNDLDDTGDPWCRTYFTGALYYKIFNPIYRREDKMRCLEIFSTLCQVKYQFLICCCQCLSAQTEVSVTVNTSTSNV